MLKILSLGGRLYSECFSSQNMQSHEQKTHPNVGILLFLMGTVIDGGN